MKTVQLNVDFTYPRSGSRHYSGEFVRVSNEVARALVGRGHATFAKPPKPAKASEGTAEMASITKPVTDPTALRGEAKKAWLREQITAKGAEPEADTITALMAQLKSLG